MVASLGCSKLTPTNHLFVVSAVALVVGLMTSTSAVADITLPKIFSDHMVLQRGDVIQIWGNADGEESLDVKLGNKSVTVTVGNEGTWKASIPSPSEAGPFDLEIVGKSSKLVLSDVLLGEVWLCSGQSNMNWPLKNSKEGAEEIKASSNDKIRLFKVPQHSVDKRLLDIEKTANWESCNEKTSENFSAVAYHFGKRLQQELDCPIGLIQSAWGGTPVESWTPRADLENDKTLAPLLKHWDERASDAQNPHRPANLFNGMISPILPFKIRGAIWYQGESNVGRGYQYSKLFPILINSWRQKFNDNNMPFIFVGLAPFRYQRSEPFDLPEVWDAQFKALEMKSVGMAVTTDIGNVKDIHPRNKTMVGKRLSLWALANVYGKKDLVLSGPIYNSHKVEGNKIRILFSNVGGGLVSRDGKPISDFTISGSDEKFFPAKAVIEGDALVVSADEVVDPVAVRFAWTDTATPNFFNKEGLPAAPFRTDQFELKSKDKHFR